MKLTQYFHWMKTLLWRRTRSISLFMFGVIFPSGSSAFRQELTTGMIPKSVAFLSLFFRILFPFPFFCLDDSIALDWRVLFLFFPTVRVVVVVAVGPVGLHLEMDQRVLDGPNGSCYLSSLLPFIIHRLAGSIAAQNGRSVAQLWGYSHQLPRQPRDSPTTHQGVPTEAVQEQQLIRRYKVCFSFIPTLSYIRLSVLNMHMTS